MSGSIEDLKPIVDQLKEEKEEKVPQIETEKKTKLSEIFDWNKIMSIKGESGLYFTSSKPDSKTGRLQLAKLDLSKKVIRHQMNVRPVQLYLSYNAGRYFDIMHEYLKDESISFEVAAISAIEDLNKLMVSEHATEVSEVKKANAQIENANAKISDTTKHKQITPLPQKVVKVEMYNSRRFIKWYIFLNEVLSQMTHEAKNSK